MRPREHLPLMRHVPVLARPRIERTARSLVWTAGVPLLRARARRRLAGLAPGRATVVTVNWDSWAYLAVLVDTVLRRSPPATEILVVDNASCDGSRARLAADERLTAVLLPVNLGHDLALDIGVLRCRTEFVVTLDVDAFPLHEHWLEALLEPLRRGAQVSGGRLNREYVHPCCWSMRTARFVSEGHSFRSHYVPRAPGRDASGDVGEELSTAEAPALHFLEVTSQRGPGDVGTVFGDVVYHNFYATRFRGTRETRLDGMVAQTDAEGAWDEALRRYVR
jgi:glycosyltransferase involved in cell wall biosynthesis